MSIWEFDIRLRLAGPDGIGNEPKSRERLKTCRAKRDQLVERDFRLDNPIGDSHVRTVREHFQAQEKRVAGDVALVHKSALPSPSTNEISAMTHLVLVDGLSTTIKVSKPRKSR